MLKRAMPDRNLRWQGRIPAHAMSHSSKWIRRGSKGQILTDFLNEGPSEKAFKGARGYALPGSFLDFNSLKFPFPGF